MNGWCGARRLSATGGGGFGLLRRSPPAPLGDGRGEVPLGGFRGGTTGVELPQLGGVWGGSPMIRAGRSPVWRGCLRAGNGKLEFDLQLPDEGGQFAGDGDDGLVFIFAPGLEFDIAFVEAVLHAPGEFLDFGALSDLAGGEAASDFGCFSEVLGAFDEHPPAVAVAAFGDGALPVSGAAGVFSGNKPEESHEGARMAEAPQVSQLADDGHGGDFLEALAGHEGVDHGFPFPVFEQLFHAVDKSGDALDATVDGLHVFFKNGLVGVVGHDEFAQVAHVGGGPFAFAGVVESVAQEKGVEALLGAGEIVAGIGAGAADVADGLVQHGRDADLGDVAVTEEAGDFAGIALVGFDLLVGFALGLGRRHEDTVESVADQAAGEDESGGARLVADLEVAEPDIEFFGELAQGPFRGENTAAAGSVIDGVFTGFPGGIGDGDCFLVDVESDVVGFGHGVFRSLLVVG